MLRGKSTITTALMARMSILLVLVLLYVLAFNSGYLFLRFRQETARSRSAYIEGEKRRIREEVEMALAAVGAERDALEEGLKTKLKEEVDTAYAIAESLYSRYKASLDREAMERLIIESLRPYRFNGGRGYLFMTRLDGVELLFADKPEMEGRSLLGLMSADGKPVIKDMIRIARAEEGRGFYSYAWTKPGATGNDHEKLAYIRSFPALQCFIGTGEYLEDYENERKASVLTTLASMNSGEPNYYFAGQMDGLSLLGPALGKNMWDAQDADGRYVVRELASVAKSGGGFVEYRMPKQTGLPPARKISYTLPMTEWQWYLGAGVFVDAIEAELTAQGKAFAADQLRSLIIQLIVLVLVGAALWFMAKRSSGIVTAEISRLNEYLMESAKQGLEASELAPFEARFSELELVGEQARAMTLELARSQERLRQSEKLQALGELAGGVAHDFNNQLTGILGYADMIHQRVPEDSETAKHAQAIINAAQRSAELTARILAFARKAPLELQAIDINTIVSEAAEILSRTLNRNIEVVTKLRAEEALLRGDPALLQNSLLNLGLNARDAMPSGGSIIYRTEKLELSEAEAAACIPPLSPGPCLRVSVEDTGTGIPPQILGRIFDPYFTTKKPGQGTGIGLAVVAGTVRAHHGAISVRSNPGEGSFFSILLPALESGLSLSPCPESPKQVELKNRSIFLLDDEEAILRMSAAMLDASGASVTCFKDGRELLACLREGMRPELLVLDMIMPLMGGAEVFALARKLTPDLPVLITSGFSSDSEVSSILQEPRVAFLAKPYRLADFVSAISGLLS